MATRNDKTIEVVVTVDGKRHSAAINQATDPLFGVSGAPRNPHPAALHEQFMKAFDRVAT